MRLMERMMICRRCARRRGEMCLASGGQRMAHCAKDECPLEWAVPAARPPERVPENWDGSDYAMDSRGTAPCQC